MKRTSASVGHQKADWEVAVHVRIGLSVLCMPHGGARHSVWRAGQVLSHPPSIHRAQVRPSPRDLFFLLSAQSPALPRRDGRRGLAASRSVAWQSLATSMVIVLVTATSDLCRATMHGVAQVFGRAKAINAAKSVSLKI